ncbi:MAG: ferritin [Candidatus Kapabacteria bacterium]|jgi:ferritin|nr:ferritin [Candidatus Kapabacteria bacterium]
MLNEKIEKYLNKQINAEMWSAYLYLSMSAYCQNNDLKGFANWYFVQFKEEQDHAMILFNYVNSRGGKVSLMPIAEVETEWNSILAAAEDTLCHEEKVTAMINELYSIALEEKDFATQSMLKWFIDEQVEEEESVKEIIGKLKLLQGNGFGLYTLDNELAARVYTQASPLAAKA